ncbi:hypothetical protein [Sphingobium abikonense]|uniref:hypothetical protein n=1 Tax=Sphingobium abikonense TaxID=86193 RepID=UPI003511155D
MSEELRAALGKIASGCTVNSTDAANETVKWMQGIASAALRASTDAAEPVASHEVDADGKPTDDSDPWFQLGWHRERLERAESEAATWKERAMSLRIAHPPVADAAVAGEGQYLIRKGGYYYRPNAQGYTTDQAQAGRYSLEEAIRHSHPNGHDGPRDGMSYEPAPALSHPAPAEPVGLREAVERLCSGRDGSQPGPMAAYRQGVRDLAATLSTLTRTDEASTDGEDQPQ